MVLDLFGCCCECVLLGMIRWFVVWLVWCLCSFEVRVLWVWVVVFYYACFFGGGLFSFCAYLM